MNPVAPLGSTTMLVVPGFAPLAEFAGFGEYEALAVQATGADLGVFADRIADGISTHLLTRPESTELFEGAGEPVSKADIKEWLSRVSAGPFDSDLAAYIRGMSHRAEGATFPGVKVALPPQMLVALTAWIQGLILEQMGETCDETTTLSAAGGAWMNLFMLQLGIILEPCLIQPTGPRGGHEAAEFHPYAGFAGFGKKEAFVLRKTGPLLEPAAGGVISLAYDYLLSRPESAGYFQDASHLAKRKMTLKGWWARSTTNPMDGDFHAYMSKVADSHVPGGGEDPHLVIPSDLTIALMGWVQMRVMTALNTIAPGEEGDYVFGVLGEPSETAAIGKAWMRMLTLQLGILLKPYLAPVEGAA